MKIFYNSGEMPPSPFRVGNKAYNLARLQQLRYRPFQIPEFLSVTTDVCREYFEQAGVAHTDAREAVQKIESRKVGEEFMQPIYEAAQKLKPPPIARSSATIEDSEGRSAAGVFESHRVSGTTKEDLDLALRKCYASLFSVRAALERSRTDEPVMGVLVQEYIEAQTSFVVETADTADPKHPDPTTMRITKKTGGVEGITSGASTITKSFEVRKVGYEKNREPATEAVVSGSLFVERIMGQPQDIEWIETEKDLFLLQTRPIAEPLQIPLTTYDLEQMAREIFRDPNQVRNSVHRMSIVVSQVGSLARAVSRLHSMNPSAVQVDETEISTVFGEVIVQTACEKYLLDSEQPILPLDECIRRGAERANSWKKAQSVGEGMHGKTACYDSTRPQAEGKAYVVSSENPLDRFKEGILIVRDPNAEVEPAINLSGFKAGLADHGNYNSHACINARSAGKPFATEFVDLTERVQHGSLIRVEFDKREAVVTVLKKQR